MTTIVDTAWKTLAGAPDAGITSPTLARAALGLKGKVPKQLADSLLRRALAGDDRFIEADGRWRLAEPSQTTPIDQTTFTVLDVETTGGQPAYNRVIQVGAFKVAGGRVGESFMSNIHPGRKIPPHISILTGIYDEHVANSPQFSEIAEPLWRFIGNSIFVGHNARFDYAFINSEFTRSGLPAMNNQSLCTLRLSRRLMRDGKRHNLGDAAARIGINFSDERHTAHGDAWATAKLLQYFLEQLDTNHGVNTLEALLKFQYSRYKK